MIYSGDTGKLSKAFINSYVNALFNIVTWFFILSEFSRNYGLKFTDIDRSIKKRLVSHHPAMNYRN